MFFIKLIFIVATLILSCNYLRNLYNFNPNLSKGVKLLQILTVISISLAIGYWNIFPLLYAIAYFLFSSFWNNLNFKYPKNAKNVLIRIGIILVVFAMCYSTITIINNSQVKKEKTIAKVVKTIIKPKKFQSIFTTNYTNQEKTEFTKLRNKYQYVVMERMSSFHWYLVVKKHNKLFEKYCQIYNVPLEQAMSHGYMENSGSDDKTSYANCRGVMQISSGLARGNGLVINKEIDERSIPEKNIMVGVKYLKTLNQMYGNRYDLASAAYHAGQGNVDCTIRIYLATKGCNIASRFSGKTLAQNQQREKRLLKAMDKYNINWIKLWKNPKSRRFWLTRGDESLYYLLKVATCERNLWLKENNPVKYLDLRRRYLSSNNWRWELFYLEDIKSYSDLNELQAVIKKNYLYQIPKSKLYKLWSVGNLDPKNKHWYQYARPETLGYIIKIAKQIKRINPNLTMTITSIARTKEYQKLIRKAYPQTATRGPSTHSALLAFDVSIPLTFGEGKEKDNEAINRFKEWLNTEKSNNKIYWAYEGSCFHISLNPYNNQDMKKLFFKRTKVKKASMKKKKDNRLIIIIIILMILAVIFRKRISFLIWQILRKFKK